MKKLLILIFSLIIGTVAFAQETDNMYWYKEADVDGSLVIYYMCKTDAQLNNTFKNIVKEQLDIQYGFEEPNWSSIYSGWISDNGLRKNFPKYSKLASAGLGSALDWDNYKYCWSIQNIRDGYFVTLFKRINGTVYMTVSFSYRGIWAYTSEVLAAFESSL